MQKKPTYEELSDRVRQLALLNSSQRISRVGGWEWDVKAQTMYWTDELYRIHGLTPGLIRPGSEEHIRQSLACYNEADRPAITAAFNDCVEKGKPYDHEFPFTTKDGNRKWIRTVAEPVLEDGRVVRVIGNVMDITDKKKLAAALDDSEKRFSFHLQHTPVGAITWGVNFEVLEWNPAAEKIFGYTREESIGRHAGELILPEDIKADLAGIFQDLISERGGSRSINSNVTKHGRRITCEWYNTPLKDSNGNIVGVASLVNDITERITSENNLKRIKQAIDQSFDAIGMATADGRHFYQNATFTQMFGYDLKEVAAMHPKKLYQDPDIADDVFETILRGGSWTGQTNMVSRDGRQIPIELRANAIKDDHGRVVGLVGIHLDITDRLKLESRLQQARKMEAVGTLAGGIAHDFNNILASIIGFTELALEEVKKGTCLEDNLQEVYAAGTRAKELVKQILTISRHEEGMVMPVQVVPLIKAAVKILRPTLPASIEFRESICSGGPLIVNADPAQLHQIIMNLATNAKQAMAHDTGLLGIDVDSIRIESDTVGSYTDIPPGDYVRITVSDSGCGIPVENHEKIFEPYFTTKDIGEGSGLGLSVVHGIVKSHNGHIMVHSEPEKGTSFHVYLPLIRKTPAGLPDKTAGKAKTVRKNPEEAKTTRYP